MVPSSCEWRQDGTNDDGHGNNKWDASWRALHPVIQSLSEGGKGEGNEGKYGGRCNALEQMPSLRQPSIAATVIDATIGAVGSIPPLLPLTTTAINAIDDHHCRCHTVEDNDCQKPVVVVPPQQWQWWSLLMEAAVDGSHGNGGLWWWRSSSTEAAVGWREDDAMASAMMASLANGGGVDGGCCLQLCSGGWCFRHHPVIGVDGGGKDAIAVAAINCRFYKQWLLLPPSTTTIATTAQLMVNVKESLPQWQQQRWG
jgi:hypothetical protein